MPPDDMAEYTAMRAEWKRHKQDNALIESHKSNARLLDRMADEEESNDGQD